MNSTDLKIKRDGLLEKIEAFDTLAIEEKRSLTEDETKSVKSLFSEVDGLKEEIKLSERIEANRAERAAAGASASKSEEKELEKLSEKLSMRKVVTSLMDRTPLTGAEAEVHAEGVEEYRLLGITPKGFAISSKMMEARTDIDQSTSAIAPTEVGAYVHSLRENSVLQSIGVSPLQLTADYKIPIVGAQSLAWATAENSAAADGGANFTSDTLTPFRLTGYVDMSNQILIQNGSGALSAVMADLGRETANKIDAAFFSTASVSDAPPSLGAKAGIGTFTEASYSANASILSDLVEAEQTLAEASGLSGNLQYVVNPILMGDLKKSAQVASVTPAMSGMGAGQMVNGYPITFTNSCTNATATGDGYFGNWNGAVFGFFGGMDLVLDPYGDPLLADQVRLVVHRRCDWGFPVAANFVKFTSPTA